MNQSRYTSKVILLIEDSDDDYECTVQAFAECMVMNPIRRASGGQEALDYLLQRHPFTPESSPRPGLILLDLNMYGLDGREVLRQIKSHVELKSIPVVVFTTSARALDVRECYCSGANSYLRKPTGVGEFLEVAKRLKEYWLEMAILPEGECLNGI